MSQPQADRQRVTAGAAGALGVAAYIAAVAGPLIKSSEGERLVAYRDPVGIATECVGHTGPEVRVGQRLTPAACNGIFTADQSRVIESIGACTRVSVPLDSFAAFTSFSFNVGAGTYCRKFAPLVNGGHLGAACAKLSLYVNASGHPLAGLITRRARERALCEQGV